MLTMINYTLTRHDFWYRLSKRVNDVIKSERNKWEFYTAEFWIPSLIKF